MYVHCLPLMQFVIVIANKVLIKINEHEFPVATKVILCYGALLIQVAKGLESRQDKKALWNCILGSTHP